MKKYAFNIKMIGKNGSGAHMVVGANPADTIEALAAELNEKDFIVVEEFHRSEEGLRQVGPTILNQKMIGKVREYRERANAGGIDF